MDINPLVIAAVLVVFMIILVVVAAYFLRRSDNTVEMRMQSLDQSLEYESFLQAADDAERANQEAAVSAGSVFEEGRRFLDPINDWLAQRKWGQSTRRKLARANLKLTPAEFAVSHIGAAAAGYTLGYTVLAAGDPVMSLVFAFIGFFMPRLYVGRIVSNRLNNFESQLPDTLSLWVNALRSGYSVPQAMEAIARDAPEPTQTEFLRVVKEMQLGIDMKDAMDHLLERVESEDLDLVVTAVNIQREVGGNLAEILEVISTTIRERIKLKGEIRVLTSQGRITGYLISFLPIALALFLNGVNPGYMGLLFTNQSCGWPMLGAGLTLIGIGTAVIQKIVDIEI
jgi:tight adherence protein B